MSIATECEYQGMFLRSKGNMSRTKESIKKFSSSMLTAKRDAASNHTRACKPTKWKCRRVKPSNVSGCLVAVLREGRLFLSMRLIHSSGIISNLIKFMPAPVSRRQMAVCMIVVELSYDIQSLYNVLKVRAMLDEIEMNCRGSRLAIIPSFRRFVVGWLSGGLNGALDDKISGPSAISPNRIYWGYCAWSA